MQLYDEFARAETGSLQFIQADCWSMAGSCPGWDWASFLGTDFIGGCSGILQGECVPWSRLRTHSAEPAIGDIIRHVSDRGSNDSSV